MKKKSTNNNNVTMNEWSIIIYPKCDIDKSKPLPWAGIFFVLIFSLCYAIYLSTSAMAQRNDPIKTIGVRQTFIIRIGINSSSLDKHANTQTAHCIAHQYLHVQFNDLINLSKFAKRTRIKNDDSLLWQSSYFIVSWDEISLCSYLRGVKKWPIKPKFEFIFFLRCSFHLDTTMEG